MIALILQLDYQTSVTKDKSLDWHLDVLVRTHLSTLTDASTFLSVSRSGAAGRPQLEPQTPLHHDTARCPTRSEDLPRELEGRRHIPDWK